MVVHLTPATEQRLQNIASASARTPDELAQQGINALLDDYDDLLAAVDRGRAAVRAGNLIDHEDVVAAMDELLENG